MSLAKPDPSMKDPATATYLSVVGVTASIAVPSHSATASPITALVVGSVISSPGFNKYLIYLSPEASVSIVPSAVYEL